MRVGMISLQVALIAAAISTAAAEEHAACVDSISRR